MDRHHDMSFHFKERPHAISQKKTRRRQKKIEQPKLYSEDPFPLVNHAGI
jgi:hypothetical protein